MLDVLSTADLYMGSKSVYSYIHNHIRSVHVFFSISLSGLLLHLPGMLMWLYLRILSVCVYVHFCSLLLYTQNYAPYQISSCAFYTKFHDNEQLLDFARILWLYLSVCVYAHH